MSQIYHDSMKPKNITGSLFGSPNPMHPGMPLHRATLTLLSHTWATSMGLGFSLTGHDHSPQVFYEAFDDSDTLA